MVVYKLWENELSIDFGETYFIHFPTSKITLFVIARDLPQINGNIVFWENEFSWIFLTYSYSLSVPCVLSATKIMSTIKLI